MLNKLLEGLKRNDLSDLVTNYFEIDTFEPKVDPESIVLAFFIEGEDPAQDFSRFLEFSAVDILDTEVSPAPTSTGEYVVFVEIGKAELASDIIKVLKTARYLCGNDLWKYRYRGQDGKIKLPKIKSK